MEENRKSPTKILVAIIILMAFSLLAVEYKNSVEIKKLKADKAVLKAEILNKDNQLKSERAKVENQNHYLAEKSSISYTIETVAAVPELTKYRYRRHYKSQHKSWKRQPSVSRGGARSVNVEPIIREVGAAYWPDPAQLDALVWICSHECTTPGVVNPRGFYGLFQLHNPPAWMVLGDAASETKAGCEYIRRRYGTPLAAKAWWVSHRWY